MGNVVNMAALSLSIDAMRPLNRWDHSRIQPGAVGPVGDVNLQQRLKHSAPDLPLRFQKEFAGKNQVFLGSNVSDGQHVGYDSGGGPARTIDSNWGGRRRFKTRHGYIMQDLRAPDNMVEPFVGSTPSYSWRNKIAKTFEAKRTGFNFLPLPNGYGPSELQTLRGGSFPRTTDVEPGTVSIGSVVGTPVPQQSNGYSTNVVGLAEEKQRLHMNMKPGLGKRG